jgi:hypothetical protein
MRDPRPLFHHPFAGVVLLAVLLLAGDLTLRSVHAAPDPAPPKVLTAQEFRLVDKTGAMRATLQTQEDGSPGLALYDKNGKVRVTLHVRSDGSSAIAFRDAESKPRVELAQESDGTGGLTLTNGKGTGGAALLIAPDSNPVAVFKDKDGKVVWTAPGAEIELPLVADPPAKPAKKP